MKRLERITRCYTAKILPILGTEQDVPTPDVNTDAQVMAWIMDTYSSYQGHFVPAVVTGKPLEIGGSLGRREATGRGVMFTMLQEQGFSIVAIGDASCAFYKPDGLDIHAAIRYTKKNKGLLKGYCEEGARLISNQDLLGPDVDILIPAALENQINEQNAAYIRAKIIVEAANGQFLILNEYRMSSLFIGMKLTLTTI
ncbi:MAG: Glu/Leu/Phe/Val dehydrogenase dimerization domain-containing protein [Veillonellales bacterium]